MSSGGGCGGRGLNSNLSDWKHGGKGTPSARNRDPGSGRGRRDLDLRRALVPPLCCVADLAFTHGGLAVERSHVTMTGLPTVGAADEKQEVSRWRGAILWRRSKGVGRTSAARLRLEKQQPE